MTMILTLTNVESLDNGEPTRLALDRRGAEIGRSAHTDWSLPDPRAHISSVHCEITYRDEGYWLADKSTNGTFLNGSERRMVGAHRLADGDEFLIGRYLIRVSGLAEGRPAAPIAAEDDWGSAGAGWGDPEPRAEIVPRPRPGDLDAWDDPPPPRHVGFGDGPAAGGVSPGVPPDWSAPSAGVGGLHDDGDPWTRRGPEISGRGALSGAFAPPPAPPSGGDVWGQMAEVNGVDWARGGFESQVSDPPPPVPAPPHRPGPAPAQQDGAWDAFFAASGLTASAFGMDRPKSAALTGRLLRQAIAGLVVMLEARARAKSQLGAEATSFSMAGTNPLKFARSPEGALAALYAEPQPGIMAAERAIEDGFKDLQAHQVATLMAMQGALKSTLDRFSPSAIRQRAESRGLLAKIIPAAREAELWKAYEREFEGVARGSDEAFMDVFSKAFREAYERAAGGR